MRKIGEQTYRREAPYLDPTAWGQARLVYGLSSRVWPRTPNGAIPVPEEEEELLEPCDCEKCQPPQGEPEYIWDRDCLGPE